MNPAMPHEWNNLLVVTQEELVPAWWSTYGTLKSELWRYLDKPYGIKRARRGGNGRRLLVVFDSLPAEVQDGIGDPRKLQHPLERFYEIDAKAVEYYTKTFTYDDGSYLLPEAQERYITDASMLTALLKLKAARTADRLAKGGGLRDVMQTLFHDAHSYQNLLKGQYGVAHTLPKNRQNFSKKLKTFDQVGYVSLVKDVKKNSAQNARVVTKKMDDLFKSLLAHRGEAFKPTPTEVAREYEAFLSGYVDVIDPETGELYRPQAFKPLTHRTVRAYLAKWCSNIATHALRSDNRARLDQKFIPYHSLAQPQLSGSLISIDDRQPPFVYNKQHQRVWFYCGIDLASEAMIGWVYGKSKEGIILPFYRQLLRNYAGWGLPLPRGLECEKSLNSSFEGTFLKPGAMFDYVRIEANRARSKRIEAYWKKFRYELEKSRAGWIARPHALSEPNQAHSEKPNKIIPYDVIIEECLRDIEAWNNMPHSKHKDMSRWEYFQKHQVPDAPATHWPSLLPHLGYQTKTSCRAGIVKLQQREWLLGTDGKVALGDELIGYMLTVEQEPIDVYWLDNHAGDVFQAVVYYKGQYVCDLAPKPVYNRAQNEWTAADRQAREVMSAYVASIEGFRRRQIRDIPQVTMIDKREAAIGDSFQLQGAHPMPLSRGEQAALKTGVEEEREAVCLGVLDEEENYDDLPEPSRSGGFNWSKDLIV